MQGLLKINMGRGFINKIKIKLIKFKKPNNKPASYLPNVMQLFTLLIVGI